MDRAGGVNTDGPILRPRYLLAAGLPSSARYAATASVRGLLVAEIQVFVPYRIHPSIISSRRPVVVVVVNMISILTLASLQGAERS